jgi:hypothetical protein
MNAESAGPASTPGGATGFGGACGSDASAMIREG